MYQPQPYAVCTQTLKFRPGVLSIFFGKIQEIKKKLDGHRRPPTICYFHAKVKTHDISRS